MKKIDELKTEEGEDQEGMILKQQQQNIQWREAWLSLFLDMLVNAYQLATGEGGGEWDSLIWNNCWFLWGKYPHRDQYRGPNISALTLELEQNVYK